MTGTTRIPPGLPVTKRRNREADAGVGRNRRRPSGELCGRACSACVSGCGYVRPRFPCVRLRTSQCACRMEQEVMKHIRTIYRRVEAGRHVESQGCKWEGGSQSATEDTGVHMLQPRRGLLGLLVCCGMGCDLQFVGINVVPVIRWRTIPSGSVLGQAGILFPDRGQQASGGGPTGDGCTAWDTAWNGCATVCCVRYKISGTVHPAVSVYLWWDRD